MVVRLVCQWHVQQVKRPDGSVVEFEYDALGRRTAKIADRKVHHYVWDGNLLLHEWSYDATNRPRLVVQKDGQLQYDRKERVENIITWVYDNNSFTPNAKLVGGKQHSIIADYLGTPVEAYDERGNKVWYRELNCYGQLRKGDNAFVPFLYQGQYWDEETGLAYNRFRYYAPEEGMYVSQDPIRLAGGKELYGYVRDTNTWVDVLGLAPGEILTKGTTYRGIRPSQMPATPSANDLKQYVDPKNPGPPGFSTFEDSQKIWDVTTKKGPLFDEAAKVDISKLGPDLEAFHDYDKHVSIRPNQSYLDKKGMSMKDALEDWNAGGNEHPLSIQAKQAQIEIVKRPCK